MLSDWTAFFWPQIIRPWMLVEGIFNLPWLFVGLQPLRLLGQYGALLALQALSLYVTFRVARDLEIPPWRQVLIALSPPVLWGLFMGQFDGIFLLAYYLPPAPATFLVLAKPQACLFALVEAWDHSPRAVVATGAVLTLSAWWIWRWPLACVNPVSGGPLTRNLWDWTAGIWPWSLLLLPLLARDRRWRLALSPFVLPYAGVHSLIGTLLALATTPAFLPVWALFWMRWALQIFPRK